MLLGQADVRRRYCGPQSRDCEGFRSQGSGEEGRGKARRRCRQGRPRGFLRGGDRGGRAHVNEALSPLVHFYHIPTVLQEQLNNHKLTKTTPCFKRATDSRVYHMAWEDQPPPATTRPT